MMMRYMPYTNNHLLLRVESEVRTIGISIMVLMMLLTCQWKIEKDCPVHNMVRLKAEEDST